MVVFIFFHHITNISSCHCKIIPLFVHNPIFDSFLRKKVSQPALTADCGTFSFFMNIRYAIYFFVCEQIFLILDIGMISFDVQNPNALCKASVSSVLV